ncbi:MAG: 3-dehydroquinate synthase [Dehalococcoidia bacterium]|nr:3-dehydroquinate synthase [Dehalococcoidia bacterium]
MSTPQNILLVGFMASGKTCVGKALSRLTGRPFVDADDEIVALAGKPIDQIFQDSGEAAFRNLERSVIRDLCSGLGKIIAAGGGAFVDPENRGRMLAGGLVVHLSARPETIYRRITGPLTLPSVPISEGENAGGPGEPVRPLLAGGDPMARIRSMLAERAGAYSEAHHTIETDHLTPERVAQKIVELCRLETTSSGGGPMEDPDQAAVVHHSGGSYPVIAGWGILNGLGERLAALGVKSPAYIITDNKVMRPYGRKVQWSLHRSGIDAHCFIIPEGEPSKSFQLAQAIYDWLLERKAERGQAIIAVGGGVVGDLAGFVAATFLRGVPFIQVPTSMAAMVDASIGGKVAVNLPQAKNMVGAFYQPQGVFADVQALATLGKRELSEGWAEAIKHGFILDAGLVDVFEEHAESLMAVEPEITTEVIRRSMAIKADVVSRDERETLGIRIQLNYGHTIGHALESSTEYGRFLHGEGVSIGMMGAARIAKEMGLMPEALLDRQRRLLERFNLPVRAAGVPVDGVMRAMSLDKKTAGGSNRWVLLEDVGKTVVRNDVPGGLVEATVRELVS